MREVITVSSPFAGDPRATNVWRAFEWLTGDRIDDAARAGAQRPRSPQPAAGPRHRDLERERRAGQRHRSATRDDPNCRNIEVRSSHLGVQLNPDVLRLIAGVLAGEALRK